MVLILSFFAFSCSGGYENSSLSFKLPENFLADESSSSVTNIYSLKISLSGDFSSEKEWIIDDSFYNSQSAGTFKIEDLPSGKKIFLLAEILQNESLIYVSYSVPIELLPGENDISISMHKVEITDSDRGGDSSDVESGDSSGETGGSTESGDPSGETGTSGESGGSSGETGTSGESGDSSGETGTSGESGGSSGETGTSGESGDSSGETGTSGESGGSSGETGTSGESGDSSGETGTSGESGGSSGETGTSGESGDSSGETGGSTESGGSSGETDTSTQSQTVSENFVKVTGGIIQGTSQTNNYTGVFIEGRTVTLSDFYISNIEVTQDLYARYMANQKVTVDGTEYTLSSNPSWCLNSNSDYLTVDNQDNRPVDNVTWYDAVYFCNVRSYTENLTPAYTITVTDVTKIDENDDDCTEYRITGASVSLVDGANGYRLPTEAEWEFAARGGDTSKDAWNFRYSGASTSLTSYDNNAAKKDAALDAVGWYAYNNNGGTTGESDCTNEVSGNGSHEVAQKKANALGLYDMSGNVFEWCYDCYSSSISTGNVTDPKVETTSESDNRVLRGGCWGYDADCSSVFYRGYYAAPSTMDSGGGFRLARSCTSSSN